MLSNKANFYNLLILIVVIGLHLYILSKLIFFPYPELFVYPYLTDQGLLPYKQIFDQHFPGLMFFPINLHSLGMITPQDARVWHFGIVALTQVLLFLVARKLFKSERWALFTNFLYLVWQPFFEGYVLWIDSFIPLLLLPAFYFSHKWTSGGSAKHLFWSGLFLGLALLFKQVTAPLILISAFFVFWRSKKINKIAPFAAGLFIPTIFLFGYILLLGVWEDFLYWTVTFNLTVFAQMGRKYPDLARVIRAFPVFGLAIVSWFILYLRTKSKDLLLLGIFLLGGLFYAYARFDYVHFQPALPFALLLLVSVFKTLPQRLHQPVYLGFVLLSFFMLISFFRVHSGNKILFFGELERKISERVAELTQPQDKVFALATTPHLYQTTERLPPGNIFVFQFPWFMTVAEDRVYRGIISDPPKVVVRDSQATVGGEKLIRFMPRIDRYIERYYKVIKRINGTEIMVRR